MVHDYLARIGGTSTYNPPVVFARNSTVGSKLGGFEALGPRISPVSEYAGLAENFGE